MYSNFALASRSWFIITLIFAFISEGHLTEHLMATFIESAASATHWGKDFAMASAARPAPVTETRLIGRIQPNPCKGDSGERRSAYHE
jgi:hypothetical protein